MTLTIYPSLKSIPSLIISIVEEEKLLVSFNVAEAKQGEIIRYQNQPIVLRCEIRGKIYSFHREHLDILSKSERNILFNWLEVDGDELAWGFS